MGSTGSRPRLHKVAPCKSLQDEGEQTKPQWTLPALPITMEHPSGSQGHKKTVLPPLKQEISLSKLSGRFPEKQSNTSSIIHAYPPRRVQALQPLALHTGHTSIAKQIDMARDGDVQRFSTTGKTGLAGTSRMIQGAFLEAQTALSQHSHRKRQTHLRQGRELRKQKIIQYTVNGSRNTGETQRRNLVRRPTQRNIFLDETGEPLDPSCLLEPKRTRSQKQTGAKSISTKHSRSWICTESAEGGQIGRIGSNRICDPNLDQNMAKIQGHIILIKH